MTNLRFVAIDGPTAEIRRIAAVPPRQPSNHLAGNIYICLVGRIYGGEKPYLRQWDWKLLRIEQISARQSASFRKLNAYIGLAHAQALP